MVLGGGAAGCAAAGLLARLGHDVALVRPARPAAAALAQSIPPSAERLLLELGMLGELERARLHPNRGNTVWWADAPARVETFDEGRAGVHLDRAGLEDVVLRVARAAGVRVYDAVARAAEEHDGGWAVACAGEAGDRFALHARWLLDATGRRGLVARREGRAVDHDTITVALVRRWRSPGGFGRVDPTHTLVESYRSGWAWSVPLGPEVRCVAAMVDHRRPGLSARSLDAALDAELDQCPRIGALREGASPMGAAWACAASLYTARRFARPGLLLVGDAGSFIDPLSSFGVKKALASGWRAAVAAHTALSDPAMATAAAGFFDERERDVYRAYRARSADFFEACAHAYRDRYWTARAEAARGFGSPVARTGDPDALEERGVAAEAARVALDEIRARPALNAVRGSSVRLVERPLVRGHRLRMAEHLASEGAPEGLRYVRNVDLLRLVEVAPLHEAVPDGWAAYNAGTGGVTLPDYLAALATAFAAGLLEHAHG